MAGERIFWRCRECGGAMEFQYETPSENQVVKCDGCGRETEIPLTFLEKDSPTREECQV